LGPLARLDHRHLDAFRLAARPHLSSRERVIAARAAPSPGAQGALPWSQTGDDLLGHDREPVTVAAAQRRGAGADFGREGPQYRPPEVRSGVFTAPTATSPSPASPTPTSSAHAHVNVERHSLSSVQPGMNLGRVVLVLQTKACERALEVGLQGGRSRLRRREADDDEPLARR
jgi:hypothetical protein